METVLQWPGTKAPNRAAALQRALAAEIPSCLRRAGAGGRAVIRVVPPDGGTESGPVVTAIVTTSLGAEGKVGAQAVAAVDGTAVIVAMTDTGERAGQAGGEVGAEAAQEVVAARVRMLLDVALGRLVGVQPPGAAHFTYRPL